MVPKVEQCWESCMNDRQRAVSRGPWPGNAQQQHIGCHGKAVRARARGDTGVGGLLSSTDVSVYLSLSFTAEARGGEAKKKAPHAGQSN